MEENVKLNVERLAAELVCRAICFNDPTLTVLSVQITF